MIYVSYRLLSVFFPGLVSSCLLSWPCLLLSSFLALSPIPGLVSPYSLRIFPYSWPCLLVLASSLRTLFVFLALSPIPGLVSPYSLRIPGLVSYSWPRLSVFFSYSWPCLLFLASSLRVLFVFLASSLRILSIFLASSLRILSVFLPGLVSSCLLSWPCLSTVEKNKSRQSGMGHTAS